MKIDLNTIDLSEFLVKDIIFCGMDAVLVNPNHIGTKFTQKNKIFRSSIWAKHDGRLLSAGLPKFTNFLENPENFPVPKSLDGCKIVDKIDGSLTCLDYVSGCISMRTRGSESYTSQDNRADFEYCLGKYPKIIDWLKDNDKYSLITEITTPNNKIVLDYGNEPDFWLIGAVNKDDYTLMSQAELDKVSELIGVKRPEYYTFSSMDSLMESIKAINGKEGCCLYSNNDQVIHKIKGEIYLSLHRFKSNATFENTVELFFEFGMPSYQEFEAKLIEKFDFECFGMVRGFLSIICDGWKEVKKIESGMMKFVESIKDLPTRKDKALKVISSFGGEQNNRAGMVFTLMDGKPLDKSQLMKLLYQTTKVVR